MERRDSPAAKPVVIAGTRPAIGPVRRILCLKLDHIGDFLIALPALTMLRRSFPEAEITLLCGPWNHGLAVRTGVADIVQPLSFFAAVAGERQPEDDARLRREAAAALTALHLGRFELAIDLRRDEDTRALLTLVDAAHRVGFGDASTYRYLDTALPFMRQTPAAGATRVALFADDLDPVGRHQRVDGALALTMPVARLDVRIWTDSVWPPCEDGGDDERLLGASLWGVQQTMPGGAVHDIGRDQMRFGPGWLEWEPWGRWTTRESAAFTIDLPSAAATVDLHLRVMGHTSPSHPEATVRVLAEGGQASHRFRSNDGPATVTLTASPMLAPPTARCAPIFLRGGRYRGVLTVAIAELDDWEPLSLTVFSGSAGRPAARLILPDRVPAAGVIPFPFDFEVVDAAQPIALGVEARDVGHRGGVAIRRIDVEWLQGAVPPPPPTHMEQQLTDLVALAALHLGRGIAPPDTGPASLLVEPSADSSAGPALRVMARLRRGGWFASRRRLIGIAVGASKETKHWPIAYFIELCRRLLAIDEVALVFVGGPGDADAARAVIAALDRPGRIADLVGSCRIEDLGEILSLLSGFVGLDTGTTHFAGRIGVPLVTLFGASHDPHEWGPVGPSSHWTAMAVDCAGCSLSSAAQCPIGVLCMTDLTPDMVWPEVEKALFSAAANV